MDKIINVVCDKCGTKYKVSSELGGRDAVCQVCKNELIIPDFNEDYPENGNTPQKNTDKSINLAKNDKNENFHTDEKQFKACPYCGESILKVAKKCRFCSEFLTEDTEQTQSPEQSQVDDKKNEKSGWTALLLNFLFVGLGYFYCGKPFLGFLAIMAFISMLINSAPSWVLVAFFLLILLHCFVSANRCEEIAERPQKDNGGWIGLALIIIIALGWYFGRYSIMYIMGNTVSSGNIEVSYHSPVTEMEAKSLGKFFSKETDNQISILLTKSDYGYLVRHPIKKGAEGIIDTIVMRAHFQDMAERMSSEVFNGSRVNLHLCDSWLITKREFEGRRKPIESNEPNSIFLDY